MVLNNLKENGYISNKEFKKFLKKKIVLNKREIYLIKEAQSYTEEVRRIVNTDYGFEKLYSEGLSISTPLDNKYQIAALEALRFGIEQYDKRHGWRGPITNIFQNEKWKNKVDKINLDRTLNWYIAEVKKIEPYLSEVKILKTDETMATKESKEKLIHRYKLNKAGGS